MPTIAQLPDAAQTPSTADYIPVDQNVSGSYATGKITLGALLSLLAASSMLPASMYSGTGAPTGGIGSVNGDSYVNVANGDLWQYATESGWTKVGSLVGPAGAAGAQGPAGPSYSITEQPTVTSMAGTDLLGISQGGADHTITLANALNGETIDQGTAAQPVSTTDIFWTGQGGSTMLVQNFAAVWAWIVRQFPGYFLPVVELTANTQLDSSVHNGRLIICSQPITISSSGLMGSGFQCTIVNVSSGTCNLSGFTTSSSNSTLTPGQSAIIYTGAYSLGTVSYAMIAGGASTPPSPPGTPTGLTAGAPTASAVPLSWTAPGTGGAPASYTLQYQVQGGTSWTQISGISGTSCTVTGLAASTIYNFQLQAVNAGGSSAFTATTSATTAAGIAPGVPTGLTAGSPTSNSVALSWTAPSVGGNGATYNVQYQWQSGGSWTQISGISGTSYTVTGLAASTTYDFEVQTVNGGLTSAWTSAVSEATTAAGNYLLTYTGTEYNNVPQSGGTYSASQGGIIAQININTSSADGSYSAPAAVYFAWGTSGSTYPTSSEAAGGYQSTESYTYNSHNLMVQYINAPSSTGTYYLWAIAVNSGGSVVATYVWPATFTIT
jgi:Fibronectin type III domain